MKYSICGDLLLNHLSDKDKLECVAKEGFKFYEFWTWNDKDINFYKNACEDLGLKISAFSGDDAYSMVEPEEETAYLNYFEDSIECAKFLGTDTLIVHSDALLFEAGIMPAKQCVSVLKEEDKYKNCVERLKQMSLIADKADKNISIEILNTKYDHPGYFLNSLKTGIDICEEIGSERIKLLYDVYHIQLMEGNIINNFNNCFDYLGYVHYADVPGRFEPETGELNCHNILKSIENMGYDGYVGFECLPSVNFNGALESIAQLIKRNEL